MGGVVLCCNKRDTVLQIFQFTKRGDAARISSTNHEIALSLTESRTMANYFNTLPLRMQLAELAKCRFMHLDEFTEGVDALMGKKIVVIGCGAQGLNQGLNLRDSGLDAVSYTHLTLPTKA